MYQSSIVLFLFPILLSFTNSLHCSSECVYSNAYAPMCTLSSDSSKCTGCDPRFYTISGTTCQLNRKGIFNATVVVDQSDWSTATGVNTETIDSESDWIRFNDNARINAAKILAGVPYGIQCRILMYFEEPTSYSFNPSVSFFISNTNSEQIELIPQSNPSSSSEWIFTTKFYNFTDSNLILSLIGSDLSTTTSSDFIAFKDTRCLIAYCVEECLSCTNLNDCTACSSGFVLSTTRQCIVECPGGEYEISTGGICEMCDSECELCFGESNNCTLCKNSGPYLSFFFENECFVTCPNNTHPNYLTQTCDCPEEQSYFLSNLTCFSCDPACKTCYGTSSYECITCSLDYFRGLTSSRCTICGAIDTRWFFNHTCLTLCPNGYEGNNATSTCDICPLSMYSFENVCYSSCPLYYYANDEIRACVVTNGYPLNLTFDVEDETTLKFTMKFLVGISSSSISLLNSTTNNFVSLWYTNTGENNHILNSRMLLASTKIIFTKMVIHSVSIDNNTLILYSSTLSADNLIFAHNFKVNFQDNVLSPNNVVYRIDASNTTDSAPWIVKEYFDANTRYYYLIGGLIALAALLLLLVQAKNIHRILVEFLQCIQLLGLTLFSLYPYSSQLDVYSFVTGLDYSNFSFMYNAPANHIAPCIECSSLTSYGFAIGDMNWFRIMGSIIPCIMVILIFCVVLGLFSFSKEYSLYLVKVMLELIFVKVIHGWFCSLVFVGLNHDNSDGLYNYYLISIHLLSYIIFIPILYLQIRNHKEQKTTNITTLFLILYICLITIISITPILIGSLLLLISLAEWAYLISINAVEKFTVVKEMRFGDEEKVSLSLMIHNYIFRSMRPMTMFLISCILLLENATAIIALISILLGIYFILIIIDSQLLSSFYFDQNKVSPMNNLESEEKMAKESIHEHREMEDKDGVDENSIDGTLNRNNKNANNSKGFNEKESNGAYYASGNKSFKKIEDIKEGTMKAYGDSKSNRNIFDEIENKIRSQVAKIRKDETVKRLK